MDDVKCSVCGVHDRHFANLCRDCCSRVWSEKVRGPGVRASRPCRLSLYRLSEIRDDNLGWWDNIIRELEEDR